MCGVLLICGTKNVWPKAVVWTVKHPESAV